MGHAHGRAQDRFSIRLGQVDFDPIHDQSTFADPVPTGADERVRVILQFNRALTREDQTRLRHRFGLQLVEYIPQLAYSEFLEREVLERLSGDPAYRARVPYRAEFKVAARIGERAYRMPERRRAAGLYLEIVLFAEADPRSTSDALAGLGARGIRVLDARGAGGPARIRATVDASAALDRIAELDTVRWVDEVGEVSEDNGRAAGILQSGDAGRSSVWAAGLHGEGQVVGVIDSSRIYLGHCFFRDSPNNTPGPAHRKVLAVRDVSRTDPGTHATFVAGCVAGDDLRRPGAHPHRGGAWAARLVSGNTKDLEVIPLLVELTAAAAAGATIHTNSWHHNSAGNGQPAIYNQWACDVDAFTWLFEDHLVLGSAGNKGEEQGPPGTAKNAVCVCAGQADPEELTFGDGMSGPTADGRRKPDLMAPGCAIESAKVNTDCRTIVKSCSSSWATPHAAAAGALVRQYFTEGRYPTGNPNREHAFVPSGALLKAMLLSSTVDTTSGGGFPSDRDGWGVIRLDTVIALPGKPVNVTIWDRRNADGLYTGQIEDHRVDVGAAAQSMKVTLVWSDPPGSPGSAQAIVNDLDLEVVSPDGTQTFRGNWLIGGVSIVGGSTDKLNNVELVRVNSPAPGSWTIRVRATAVNVGNPGQGYALVVKLGRAARD